VRPTLEGRTAGLTGTSRSVYPKSIHRQPGRSALSGWKWLTDCPLRSAGERMWDDRTVINPHDIELRRFLSDWIGAPTSRRRRLSEDCAWLPEPLREWHELASEWTVPVIHLKQMCPPERIASDGHYATFMEDPTGDWFWSFSIPHPDSVYDRELHESWQLNAEPLSEFLIHNVINEVVENASRYRVCDHVPLESLEEVVQPMREVAFGGWRWPVPGTRIFMGDSVVAEVAPALDARKPWGPVPGHVSVRVVARRSPALSYLDNIDGLMWIRNSR
jgi:hypothetical protein